MGLLKNISVLYQAECVLNSKKDGMLRQHNEILQLLKKKRKEHQNKNIKNHIVNETAT